MGRIVEGRRSWNLLRGTYDEKTIEQLAGNGRLVFVRQGQQLVDPRYGEPEFNFILSGSAHAIEYREDDEFLTRHPKGILRIIWGPGEMFGALDHVQLERFRIVARTDCLIGKVAADAYTRAVSGVPYQAIAPLLRDLTSQFWRALQRYGAGGGERPDLKARLALTLLQFVPRFGVPREGGKLLDLSLTHQELADLIGANRISVTVLLSQFIDEGVVQRRGRQLLVDTSGLSQIARTEDLFGGRTFFH